MKKWILFLASMALSFSIVSTANATVAPSWYLGLQLGWTDTNYSANDLGLSSASIDSDGFGGRVYAGYQHNENFAFELGYTYFSKTDADNIPVFIDEEPAGTTDGDVKQYAIDATFKPIFPLTYGLAVYGRLGVAYVSPDESSAIPKSLDSEFNVLYGAGISYDILPNLVADFSYTRINGSGDIQDTEMAAIGIQYHFDMS